MKLSTKFRKMNIPANQIKPGDKLNRFGHFHPVSVVGTKIHPLTKTEVVEVTHDRGTLCYIPTATVEIERE